MRSVFSRLRPLAALPLLVGAAGCSSSPPASSFMAQADATAVVDSAATRPVSGPDLATALASMPEPGGSQIAIREKVFSNGVKQDIVLGGDRSGSGENTLQITVQSAPAAAGMRNTVPIYRPSESGIKGEIIARYPHMNMQILTQPRRNSMGPFGLAIGRNASGVRCVYAWQWIDDVRSPGSTPMFGNLGSLGASGQPAAVRVGMCRKDATVDDLAMAVEGLTLAPGAVIDRALDGSRTPTASTVPAGGGGMAVAAADGTLEGALTTSVRPGRQVADRSDAPARRRVARRAKKPAEPEESVAQQTPAAPAQPVYSSGPRYLAPVAGQAAGTYASAPASGPATAYNVPAYGSAPAYGGGVPSTKSLDPSLPAAAYRGPSGRAQ